jgi:TRAP-type C4-dicarboxylate transport system substrate-binding protein
MPRRRLITALCAGIALGFAAPQAASAQEIKISHQWKQNTDARDKATRLFVKEVNKRDPGLKFRIYPSGSLIAKPVTQLDALQNGSLEMAVYPLVYATGKVPEFSITILPGAYSSIDQAVKLKGTPFYDELQRVAEKNGIHIVTWWWTPGGFASKSQAISGPESVKGLSMRAADPTFEYMLKAAGASIQSMPSTEIYPALQSGVLDTVMTSDESFVSMRIYEQTKYATAGGDYTIFLLLQPLIMAKPVWDKLTPAQKKAFEEAATLSEQSFNEGQKQVSKHMVDTFKKAGNEVRPLTKAEYDQWVELAKKTSWQEFAKISEDSKKLLALLEQAR